MPEAQSQQGSTYNQQSFEGGMNLLGEDTSLQTNQYRIGFNVRNRYGRLDLIPSSQEDTAAPIGNKQEAVTFGEYEIVFANGLAYYKHYTRYNWTQIIGFAMSATAPRYWTCEIPVAQTNYYRIAGGDESVPDALSGIKLNAVAGAASGNLPGLLVQDNVNQPVFIFLDESLVPTCRTTQKYEDWKIVFTDADNVIVAENTDGTPQDYREYVPVGNVMAFVDGILYVASPDGTLILRSVEGRPLDFVIAISNSLAGADAKFTQVPVGDAYSTAYSVGVGGIAVLRGMSDGSLFVAASNANFLVRKNTSNIAPKLFGEWTFTRQFLFNANVLSDRGIFDSIGDTRFIDLYGVRSFNAISQIQNEGRNSPFSATIQSAFGTDVSPIVQNSSYAASILFNNYELYAVDTIFGPAIAVYDTLLGCWSSFDVDQTKGKRVKKFFKIELAIQALFCLTEDDKIYRLYVGPEVDTATVRGIGICANILYLNSNIKVSEPKNEIKPSMVRVIVNGVTEDCSVTMTQYVNNRISAGPTTQSIAYRNPVTISDNETDLPDVNTLLSNRLFSTPNAKQGWKTFVEFTWTDGYITQFSVDCVDITPMNPSTSQ